MKIKRGWWALASMVAASVVVLLAFYAGAYYATVDRMYVITMPSDLEISEGAPEPVPKYRPILGFKPDRFFAPMHEVDKRLRPKVWKSLPAIPLHQPPIPEGELF
ncbi:MAG TPA: hypothetical protein VHB77_23450 [Planctomycetaceae bacterium]|nr:hypothetical protein [Planctomycetaceae bacterium]